MIPRDPLTLQRQLAGLATLEATVRTTLRGLYTTYRNPSTSSVRLRPGGGLISLRACGPSAAVD
jgi:hypothetical protein